MNSMNVETLTVELMKFNSYEASGKVSIVEYVKNIIETETDAEVIINDDIEPVLIAKLKGTESKFKLLLEGHLDVVKGTPNQFTPEWDNRLLRGRGSVDMKSGCACILSAFVAAAKRNSLKADLTLVFTTDEETTGATIKHLFDTNLLSKHDFALIPEPTDGQICNAHKGQSWFTVEFTGKSSHSSLPHLGHNAIYMAMDFTQHLRRNTQEYIPHPKFGKETVSVGCIEGGTDPNVVPDYTKVRVDKRYLPHQNLNTGLDEINLAIEQCHQNDPHFQAKVTVEGDWSGLLTSEDTPYFGAILDTVSQSMNQDTDIVFWTAWGEGAYISAYGTPTIYFGPGQTALAHTENEFVDLAQVIHVEKAYHNIINTLCE